MNNEPSFLDLHDPGDVLIYVCVALVVCILFLALTCACGWIIRQCCRFLGDEEPLDCSWQDHGDAVFVDELDDSEAPFVHSRTSTMEFYPGISAVEIISNAVTYKQLPLLVFSLDTSAADLTRQVVARMAHVDYSRVRNGQLTGEDVEAMGTAVKDLSQHSIWFHEGRDFNIHGLIEKARRWHGKHRAGFVLIDGLELLAINSGCDDEKIIANLKALIRDTNMKVKAVCRAVETSSAAPQLPQERTASPASVQSEA